MTDKELIQKLCVERNNWQATACTAVSCLRYLKKVIEGLYHDYNPDIDYTFIMEMIDSADPGDDISVGYGSGEENV